MKYYLAILEVLLFLSCALPQKAINIKEEVQNKQDTYMINVKDFGANPNDTREDTEAIQAAVNAAHQQKKSVVAITEPGIYIVNQISIKQSNLSIYIGNGVELKKTGKSKKQGVFTLEMFKEEAHFHLYGEGSINLNRVKYKDNDLNSALFAFKKRYITIDGITFKNSSENFLKFVNCSNVEVKNSTFDNGYNIGIEFNFPITATNCKDYSVKNCTFKKIDDYSLGRANGIAIAFAAAEFKQSTVVQNVSITDCKFEDNLRDIHFEFNAKKTWVQNVLIEKNSSFNAIQNSIALVGVKYSIVKSNYIEQPGIQEVINVKGNTVGIIISTIKNKTAIITDNIIVDERPQNQTEFGILVTGGTDIIISSNYVNAGYNAGIKVANAKNSVLVQNNIVKSPNLNQVGIEVFNKPRNSSISTNIVTPNYKKGLFKIDGKFNNSPSNK